MNLLLDTHIFLWSLIEPRLLTSHVTVELENPSNALWLSPITVWETLILAEKGRVTLAPDPIRWIRNVRATIPFHEAILTEEIAIESRRITLPHQDPADRFLAATACVHGLTLVTADDRLLQSDEYSILPNRS